VEEQTATTNEIGRNVTEAARGTNEIAKNNTGVAGSRGAARARPVGPAGMTVVPMVRPPPRSVPSTVARPAARVEVVSIGVSTGGPNALAELLPEIPVDLRVPILIVQHMPPLFTRLLAERLNSKSALTVKEGAAGDRIEAGTVYLAPGNHHMVVERSKSGGYVLGLNQREAENSCRPSVDVLFRAVGDCFGPAALAVIMTGMGQDGLRGCELIRERGGQVLAQDEKSSVVWGMPGYVVEAGLADQVLPLDRLAAAIVRQVNGTGSASGSGLARNPAESWSQRKVGLT
jgi:two-component system chemotaxis response regulator CheB